jgi:hypothetical protein
MERIFNVNNTFKCVLDKSKDIGFLEDIRARERIEVYLKDYGMILSRFVWVKMAFGGAMHDLIA